MKSLYHIFIIAVLILFGIDLKGQESPKRELRGVWIATVWGIDWPSVSGTGPGIMKRQQNELREILDRCKRLNLTTVFFQVRSMGDVMFESKTEPWSGFVSGKRGVSPGWDPLELAVRECHERGLECYAWVNPFRWSSGTDYNTVQDRKWKNNGWLLRHGKYTVFNPGLEEVRQHVVDVCREIIDGYGVDGLVFDDYFYPNRIPATNEMADYGLYQQEAPWMTFGDWRRANIHKAVADVRGMIRDRRPDVRFGISPAGVAGKSETSALKWGAEPCDVKASDWQYEEIYSDPLGLMYQGTLDFVSPQLYWSTTHSTAPYEPLARWWTNSANLYGRHYYSSVTLERLDQGDVNENIRDLGRQIEVNRRVTLDGNLGFVIYSAKFLPRVESLLSKNHFAYPSLSPQLVTGLDAPAAPGQGSIEHNALRWKPVSLGDKEIVRYSVYAVPRSISREEAMAENGDGVAGEYLLGVTYSPSFTVDSTKDYRFAVCTLDGYSAESVPLWIE